MEFCISEIYIISYPSLVPNLFCRVEKTGLKHPLEYVVNCLQRTVSGILLSSFCLYFKNIMKQKAKHVGEDKRENPSTSLDKLIIYEHGLKISLST